jgi:hypothetical protein
MCGPSVSTGNWKHANIPGKERKKEKKRKEKK